MKFPSSDVTHSSLSVNTSEMCIFPLSPSLSRKFSSLMRSSGCHPFVMSFPAALPTETQIQLMSRFEESSTFSIQIESLKMALCGTFNCFI